MRMVKVSAPGKLMLFGEHAVIYGRPCIVTAVDQRITVICEEIVGDELSVLALDLGIKDYHKKITELGSGSNIPKEVKFVELALKNYRDQYGKIGGLKITTKSDFSSKFGFGSSSAVTVAVLKAVSELYSRKLTNKQLFDLSYKTVLDVQGVGSGFDLAAAIWGGTLYFVGGGKTIRPLKTKPLPLVVGYTGVKADTTTLVKQVGELYKKERVVVNNIFEIIEMITKKASHSLLKGDWVKLGMLMNMNQGLLESLEVGSDKLSSLIYAAKNNGAYGAKLSGAGGGDCMMALVDGKNTGTIKKAIRKQKGEILDVQTGAEGVRIEL